MHGLIFAAPAIYIWNNFELYGNDSAVDCAVTDKPRQWRKLLQAGGATGISVLHMVHQEVGDGDLICESFTKLIYWTADMAAAFRPQQAQPSSDCHFRMKNQFSVVCWFSCKYVPGNFTYTEIQ